MNASGPLAGAVCIGQSVPEIYIKSPAKHYGNGSTMQTAELNSALFFKVLRSSKWINTVGDNLRRAR